MTKWEPASRGESYTLQLTPVLKLVVQREIQSRSNPSPFPYAAIVFGVRLKANFGTVGGAQAAAIRAARAQLAQAAEALGPEE